MGGIHDAHCECGFRTEVEVGGGQMDFQTNSPFPFYCTYCGLVSVNTARRPYACSGCGASEVTAYGNPPISTVPEKGMPVLMSFSYEAYAKDNLCPACKKMTLVFDHAKLMFD